MNTVTAEEILAQENKAHDYANKWPEHQYMPARQGFSAGFVAGVEYATSREAKAVEELLSLMKEMDSYLQVGIMYEGEEYLHHKIKQALEKYQLPSPPVTK